MPGTIDGTRIQSITIDGEEVREVTMDGDVVWTGGNVIDDFEWGGPLSDRYTEFYSGHMDRAHVEEGGIRKDGNYSMHLPGDPDHTNGHEGHFGSLPGDGLDHYPSAGDHFRFWFYWYDEHDSISLQRFQYAVQGYNTDNLYRFDIGDDSIDFKVRQNASNTSLLTFFELNPSDSLGWRGIDVDWQTDGTKVVTILDADGSTIEQQSTVDTTFDSGGVAYYSNGYLDCLADEWVLVDQ